LTVIAQLDAPPLFPYTTLFRSRLVDERSGSVPETCARLEMVSAGLKPLSQVTVVDHLLGRLITVDFEVDGVLIEIEGHSAHGSLDRKSTRLNSSHLVISYAVFC